MACKIFAHIRQESSFQDIDFALKRRYHLSKITSWKGCNFL